jgi:RecA-family ATPase
MKPELTAIVPVERVLDLAKKYPVFPCRRNDEKDSEGRTLRAKSPLTKNGFKDATQDEAQIKRWWADRPDALVGVPTGSRTGLAVLDYDHRAASHAAQEWLVENQQALTSTRVHQTGGGSGGRHYLFSLPHGVKIRGGVSVTLGKVKRDGIDIRAEGGYIIWWPLHYGQHGLNNDIQPLPAGLIDERRMDLELPAELAKKLPPKPGTSQDFQRDLSRITEALAYVDPAGYDAWLMVGMALHYASGGADDGLELWDSWSSGGITGELPANYAGRADMEYRWQSFHLDRGGGVTLGSLFNAAKAGGWVSMPEAVRIGPPVDMPKFEANEYADVPEAQGMIRSVEPDVSNQKSELSMNTGIVAKRWEPISAAAIPPREWLYGFHYMRRMVSMTAGAGGGGKSSMTMVEAVSMAIGRDLLRGKWALPTGALRVWVHNGEDPMDELQRRLVAICMEHGVEPSEVAGNLFLTSGRDTRIIVAEELDGTVVQIPAVREQVVQQMREQAIDVMILDPFIATHAVNENNNPAMEKVMWEWRAVAEQANVAVEIVHHFRKGNGNEASSEDVRGASALLGACRSVRIASPMSQPEAERYAIDVKERRRYFWLQNPKANMRPPTDERLWRQLVSVSLGNGNAVYNEGDKVGVVRDWSPPTADTHLTSGQKAIVLRDIEGAYNKDPLSTRCDVRSVMWVGRILAQHMELDLNDAGARSTIRRILEEWEKDGSITKVSVRDHAKGRYVQGYKVGEKGEAEEEEVPF